MKIEVALPLTIDRPRLMIQLEFLYRFIESMDEALLQHLPHGLRATQIKGATLTGASVLLREVFANDVSNIKIHQHIIAMLVDKINNAINDSWEIRKRVENQPEPEVRKQLNDMIITACNVMANLFERIAKGEAYAPFAKPKMVLISKGGEA